MLNFFKGKERYLELFSSSGTEVPLTDDQLYDLEMFHYKAYEGIELNFVNDGR